MFSFYECPKCLRVFFYREEEQRHYKKCTG